MAALVITGVMMLPAAGASLPGGFKDTQLLTGLNPTTMDIAADGRVFYCEKNGRVRVVKNDVLLPKALVSLDVDIFQERGLLGIALDPGFPGNPYVYLYYTVKSPAHNRISRFKVEGDTAVGAEQVLLDLDNLTSVGWHNGGGVRFGKDGKLFIATGNNTNSVYSQSLTSDLGKILRINPDGSIPADNPFYDRTTGNNRAIWALGLRNPFTIAVQPGAGKFLIDEVGEGSFEEIDEGLAGANYGWPKAEGHATSPPTGLIGPYADPIYFYSHGDACAITGGAFYQPADNTFGGAYLGEYFFGDYCAGWINTLDVSGTKAVKTFATGISRPLDVKVAPDGSLYYLARGKRAAGVGQGSEQDNTSAPDGSLNKVTGPVSAAVNTPRDHALVLAPGLSRRAILPKGKTALILFDAQGSRLWEFRRGADAGKIYVQLPDLGIRGMVFLDRE